MKEYPCVCVLVFPCGLIVLPHLEWMTYDAAKFANEYPDPCPGCQSLGGKANVPPHVVRPIAQMAIWAQFLQRSPNSLSHVIDSPVIYYPDCWE